jgi:hypothetical protein
LADTVLPINPFGRIRTGDKAEDKRTHAGLYWPPEARIKVGEPLRRAPIPYVWRALVEAGDRIARWNVGRGVSFPLPRILASHVASLLTNGSHKQSASQRDDESVDSTDTMPVVAIPDNLDEFGQEILLRELTALGLHKAMLVWRPVAAALAWLDKVEGDFPRHMDEDDHIHIIYLGSDALEFTTFRLRVKDYNNRLYVLPLRDRPKFLPRLTGMDWAGRLIEESFEGINHGAFWQAFTNFPEIWGVIAGRTWKQEELPRAWSMGPEWVLWNPSPDLYDRIYNIKADPCDTLREILQGSCKLHTHEEESLDTMERTLQKEVRRMAQLFPKGKLRGMIVCGPLSPYTKPSWLTDEFDTLAKRGLEVEGGLMDPAAGRLWYSTDCDDPIAEGAAIYGQRTLNEIPTYLDTMPQISILAQEQGQYAWIPLLNAQEVFGGTEFKDTIEGRFQLDRGQRQLHAYLYKGPSENAPKEAKDTFDAQYLKAENITNCQARLVRQVVRILGNVDSVRKRSFFRNNPNYSRYGVAFAEVLFNGEGGEQVRKIESSLTEKAFTPLRRAVFDFPSAPANDLALDVEVRMRPASGLAKVELIPMDESFLHGRNVQLNYSTMYAVDRLPKRQRGWPRIQELILDPEDYILRQRKHFVSIFENTTPTASNYTNILNDIRDKVLKGTDQKTIAGLFLWVQAIDQNGQACTQEGNDIVRRIATKFDQDFDQLDIPRMRNIQNTMFTRATWLYTSTPQNIVTYVKDVLAGNFIQKGWTWATEAASRAFIEGEEFQFLFEAIAKRARRFNETAAPFPIQAARSICRVLMFREDGHKGLDAKMAKLFARRALERLHKEQKNRNYKILYFQLILLMLYLLRYRKTDPSCFDPNSPKTIEVFEEAMESMAEAKRFFSRTRNFGNAKRVQSIINGFEKYLHYEGTEDVLTVLSDLAGDMA